MRARACDYDVHLLPRWLLFFISKDRLCVFIPDVRSRPRRCTRRVFVYVSPGWGSAVRLTRLVRFSCVSAYLARWASRANGENPQLW